MASDVVAGGAEGEPGVRELREKRAGEGRVAGWVRMPGREAAVVKGALGRPQPGRPVCGDFGGAAAPFSPRHPPCRGSEGHRALPGPGPLLPEVAEGARQNRSQSVRRAEVSQWAGIARLRLFAKSGR